MKRVTIPFKCSMVGCSGDAVGFFRESQEDGEVSVPTGNKFCWCAEHENEVTDFVHGRLGTLVVI
jgi:hypothetical protein